MESHRGVRIGELERVGADLHRPECVVIGGAGEIFVPDWRGGITGIRPDGTRQTWFPTTDRTLRPNGICLAPDGSFLLANLGDAGGVWRLHRDGRLDPFVLEVDGVALPPANFVTVDREGRTWISVSTRHEPRQRAWRPDCADGFVVLVDAAGARIVADGLHYTNEVRPDPGGEWLYVVETFGKQLTRFRIGDGGSLAQRETVVTLGHGNFPDGLAFDETGGIWLTSLISNRLLRFHAERLQTVLEDVNPANVDAVEQAFVSGQMVRDHLGPIPGTTLQQLTSLAFGGPDRRTVFLGSLHSTCLYQFRADVGGAG